MYLQAKVSEGEGHMLACPEPSCTESYAHADLKKVLSMDDWDRFQVALACAAESSVANLHVCPNAECRCHFDYVPRNSFNDVLLQCPDCGYHYCRLCLQAFGASDGEVLEHVCVVGLHRQLLEALDKATKAHCGNVGCSSHGVLVTKELEQQCNAIRCRTCRHYFCYLCCRELGTTSEEAHRVFPHTTFAGAPCPLFNTPAAEPDIPIEVRHAQHHRKRQAVQQLLSIMPHKEKQHVVRLALRRLEDEGLESLPEVAEEKQYRTLQDKTWKRNNARFNIFLADHHHRQSNSL